MNNLFLIFQIQHFNQETDNIYYYNRFLLKQIYHDIITLIKLRHFIVFLMT